jgi:hypothetical protein
MGPGRPVLLFILTFFSYCVLTIVHGLFVLFVSDFVFWATEV